MNLQQTIKRILKETREEKIKTYLFQRFDKIFDQLELKVQYDEKYNSVYGRWYYKNEQDDENRDYDDELDDDELDDDDNESNNDVFHRNNYGTIWVIKCEPYKTLYNYSKSVGLNDEEFEKLLVEYFNEKYLDQFRQRPFKTVSDENYCLEEF